MTRTPELLSFWRASPRTVANVSSNCSPTFQPHAGTKALQPRIAMPTVASSWQLTHTIALLVEPISTVESIAQLILGLPLPSAPFDYLDSTASISRIQLNVLACVLLWMMSQLCIRSDYASLLD